MSGTDGQYTWSVTYEDGTTEQVYGKLRIADGVLWIAETYPYGGDVKEQRGWPLTALRTWSRGQ